MCMCVCVWLEEVPSTTGVVTGPKFTQKCVAWGREVLWPPLTVRVEFQPPPSPSPLSPSCSATYISHHDMHDDPYLLVRWQRLDGVEERADNRAEQQGVKKQKAWQWFGCLDVLNLRWRKSVRNIKKGLLERFVNDFHVAAGVLMVQGCKYMVHILYVCYN